MLRGRGRSLASACVSLPGSRCNPWGALVPTMAAIVAECFTRLSDSPAVRSGGWPTTALPTPPQAVRELTESVVKQITVIRAQPDVVGRDRRCQGGVTDGSAP